MRRALLALAAAAALVALGYAGGAWRVRTPAESLAVPATSVPAPLGFPALPDGEVRNVILLVADGMSLANLTAARVHRLGPEGRLRLERFPVTGLVLTHSQETLITSSDTAATSLSTGRKTRKGRVGTDSTGEPLPTLLEAARAAGKSAGLVTTSEIVDATPAAFATHVAARAERAEIARQLVESGVEVLLGGGRRHFLPESQPGGERQDGVDLLATARRAGYRVVLAPGDLPAAGGERLLGLFWEEYSPYAEGDQPSLATMTAAALERLARDPDGFFLMAEEEGTDTLAHRNQGEAMAGAVLRFDEAAAVAAEFAARDGRTLVVATADHSTGGLVLRRQLEGKLEIVWTTTSHSGEPVPLFAYGPGAARFTGLRDNTEIARLLWELLAPPVPSP
jgi:alkaline phosphatase